MATIATLVDDVRTHTGQSGLTLLTSLCETFINNAILRMERRHNFRGQQVTLDPLPYPANTDFVPVPSDFVTERAVWQKNQSQTDPSRALAPMQSKTLRRTWIESQNPAILRDSQFPAVAAPSATPLSNQGYYIWNRGLYLVPTPSAAGGISLVLDYIRVLPDLTGTQNNWFTDTLPDVVRSGAVAEAYRYLQEADAATLWEAVFQARITDAIRTDETLSLSGPPASRGRGDN
jgi:hypothetical protein